jgi:cytochrome c556
MPKTRLLLATAAMVVLAGAAAAQRKPVSAPMLNPDGFVAARQASLDMSVIVFGTLRQGSEAGREPKAMSYTAQGLAKWAKVLPTLFPEGSGPGEATVKTQAKPVVWTDRAGFEQAAANYGAATAKLVELANANDAAGFKAQLTEVSAKCDACHAVYKDGPQAASR